MGTLVLGSEKDALGGSLNIAPAISPDGKLLAFLSERGLFSIDLFIADAGTGKILHKLTSTATDAALLEPAVHPLGRRVGSRERTHRHRHGDGRQAGAGHLQRQDRRQGA